MTQRQRSSFSVWAGTKFSRWAPELGLDGRRLGLSEALGMGMWSRWSESQHNQRHGRGWHAEAVRTQGAYSWLDYGDMEISGGATL